MQRWVKTRASGKNRPPVSRTDFLTYAQLRFEHSEERMFYESALLSIRSRRPYLIQTFDYFHSHVGKQENVQGLL